MLEGSRPPGPDTEVRVFLCTLRFIHEAARHALAGGDGEAAERYWAQPETEAQKTDTEELPAVSQVTDSISAVTVTLTATRPESRLPMAEPLTNRELDVLLSLEQRLANKEIAEKLFVTTETVKGHLKNIFRKLGVDSRRKAVEAAKRLGII